jgi:hypothetical protein
MQIKIEIDVKPEELRRFIGLPDVAGLQEDLINFVRSKVGSAASSFDPASFVRSNIDTLRRSRAWRRVMDGVAAREDEERVPRPRRRAKKKGEPSGPPSDT